MFIFRHTVIPRGVIHMKRQSLVLIVLALSASATLWQTRRSLAASASAAESGDEQAGKGLRTTGYVVAAGRVEPASEELKIGSELDGKLARVLVDEGDRVRQGQVLAVLVNGDYAARVALAQADVRQREADLERIVNGNRGQEKRESLAQVLEAEAVLENASLERARREALLARGAISRTEFDSADRDHNVAAARLAAARERASLADEGYRVEDRKRAEAELDSARARLAEAEALLAKTYIRSPIGGVVLRRKLRSGENVRAGAGDPVVVLGDVSRLRVRADVDETDVARIAVGQTAHVTAEAYGERKFTGKVVRVGEILGRKNVRTDEPTERVDTKILETLIELDPGQQIPLGLRVDTFIHAGGKS
jgi:HlyD family secretion protein